MAKVLVVCARRYNGQELWSALKSLHNAELDYEVVSTGTLLLDEVTLKKFRIKRTLDDLAPDESFDGLMIISGHTADTMAYWHDERLLHLVHLAVERDCPIGAICRIVPTVREAVAGKRVSFFPLVKSREILSRAGAILTNVAVSVDGKLVTAEHDMAAQMWAQAFVNVMLGLDPGIDLVDSGFTPKGGERKPMPLLEKLKGIKLTS